MNTEKKNILVVDDVGSIRAFIKDLLEEANYGVTEAKDGEEAVEIYRQNKIDLIITDVYMPIKGGLEAIVELRKEFPDAKSIVLSDGGDAHFENNREICEALGANHFLSKSLIKEKLLSFVKELIGE